jgi:molecular chaperone DnaJ
MPDVRGRGVGDLNVHIHVEVPKKLSERAEELLRELAEEEQADVSPRRSSFLTRLAEYFAPESTEKPSDKEATNNT